MANYQITCVRRESCPNPHSPGHIVVVGTRDQSGARCHWTLAEVCQALRNGDTFYTQGSTSGLIGAVAAGKCAGCNGGTLRSYGVLALDNDLDSFPDCRH